MAFSELFPESTPVHRNVPEEQRVAWGAVPAKGAVYLLVCPDDSGGEKPLLLATVGDLRAAIRRRLADAPADVKTRRVDYPQLCTRLHWRRVDSSFAASWWYWRIAREIFPATYAALIPWRASWWIGVERAGPHPRMRKTSDLSDGALFYAGPVRDKHAAQRLIETVEDLFDLCRYHAELAQAPHGRPCAYKEMGKCPAPCDGSVPLAWYRGQMDRAWAFLTGETRAAWCAEIAVQMKAAAARLEFETAGRLKQRLARAGVLEGRAAEPYRHVKGLAQFSFVVLQPGRGKPWIEPWIVHGGHVECLPQISKKELALGMERVAARYAEVAGTPVVPPLETVASEQIAITTHHLFRGEDDHGIYVRGSEILAESSSALITAAERLFARKTQPKPLVEQSTESDGAAALSPGQ